MECALKYFQAVVQVNGLVEDGSHTVGSLVSGSLLIAMPSSVLRYLTLTSFIKIQLLFRRKIP